MTTVTAGDGATVHLHDHGPQRRPVRRNGGQPGRHLPGRLQRGTVTPSQGTCTGTPELHLRARHDRRRRRRDDQRRLHRARPRRPRPQTNTASRHERAPATRTGGNNTATDTDTVTTQRRPAGHQDRGARPGHRRHRRDLHDQGQQPRPVGQRRLHADRHRPGRHQLRLGPRLHATPPARSPARSSGLTAGATDTYTITVHINSDFADGGTLTNTASLTAGRPPTRIDATTAPPRRRRSTARPTCRSPRRRRPTRPPPAPTRPTRSRSRTAGPSDNAGYTLTDDDPGRHQLRLGPPAAADAAGTVTCTLERPDRGLDRHLHDHRPHQLGLRRRRHPDQHRHDRPPSRPPTRIDQQQRHLDDDRQPLGRPAGRPRPRRPDPATAGTTRPSRSTVKNTGPSDSARLHAHRRAAGRHERRLVERRLHARRRHGHLSASAAWPRGSTDTYTITVHIDPGFADGGTI